MWVSYCDITIVARKQLQGYVTIDSVEVVNTNECMYVCMF